jgi:hypothetical protein
VGKEYPCPVWLGYCELYKARTVLYGWYLNSSNKKPMKPFLKKLALPAVAAMIFLISCTEQKTNTQETTQIQTMDSTSKALKVHSEKLEDQTKKVEASLEKLDKEFESDKN